MKSASGRSGPARCWRRRSRTLAGSSPDSINCGTMAPAAATTPSQRSAHVADVERRPGHEAGAISGLGHMGRDGAGRLGIIDGHEVEFAPVGNAVGHDDGRVVAARQALGERTVARNDDEPRGPPGAEGAEPRGLFGRRIGRGHHQKVEPVLPRHMFERRHEGAEHGIGEVGHHDARERMAAGAQPGGVLVGHVAELLHRGLDALYIGRRNRSLSVQDIGHGGGRDARARRYGMYRRPASQVRGSFVSLQAHRKSFYWRLDRRGEPVNHAVSMLLFGTT